MNTAGGLRVCIGDGRFRVPGFLSMDASRDADIPYARGEAFPFEDRAVDAIVVAGIDSSIAEAALVDLLLECRRSLWIGGALRVVMTRQREPDARAAARDAGGTCPPRHDCPGDRSRPR